METPDNGQSFGQLLRVHRSRADLTQQELADFSTVSVRAIRDLEHDRVRQPRKDTVHLLADALRLNERGRMELLAVAGRMGGHAYGLSGPHAVPSPPPTPCTPTLGRRDEADALALTLAAPGRRLVTVTGLPGVGKSRFAAEVARSYHQSSGSPVLWAAGSGGDLRMPSVGARGGLADLVERAVDCLFGSLVTADVELGGVDGLARAVGDRPALLVLDAPRPRALNGTALAHLLGECTELRVLVVGPRPHGEHGEQVFPLAPLSPEAAVDVLMWHMGDTRLSPASSGGDIAYLAEICLLLDRLPGALVSAASWLTLYDPATLVTCLREDPLPFLTPLTGGSGLVGTLQSALSSCTPTEETVLDLLCTTPEGERADALARVGGLALADCGRALNDLIVRGLVRRDRDGGETRVHPLNLVRILRSTRADLVPAMRAPVRAA